MQIEGRVALVTGGASGLGEATVKRLVELGAKIMVADRDEARGESLSRQLGGNVLFSLCDVTNEEQVAAVVDRAIDTFGRIEIVMNCAGIGGGSRTVRRDGPHNLADFKRVVGVNVFGTFSVLSQAAFRMAGNGPAMGRTSMDAVGSLSTQPRSRPSTDRSGKPPMQLPRVGLSE